VNPAIESPRSQKAPLCRRYADDYGFYHNRERGNSAWIPEIRVSATSEKRKKKSTSVK
jgi:hypothetical protein